jgi:recombination protein RecA
MGVIQKSGTWYSYGDERIGQGREMAKNFLTDNPTVGEEIEKAVREKYFGEKVEKQEPVKK